MSKKGALFLTIMAFSMAQEIVEKPQNDKDTKTTVMTKEEADKHTQKQIEEMQKSLENQKNQQKEKNEKFMGYGGIGLGILGSTWKANVISENTVSIQKEKMLQFDVQLGAITMFNKYFGLQYYIEAEVNFPNKDFNFMTVSGVGAVDALVYPYRSKNFSIGAYAGVGVGYDFILGEWLRTREYTSDGGIRTRRHFEHVGSSLLARANFGLRFLYKNGLGVDAYVKLPFTTTTAKFADAELSVDSRMSYGLRFVYVH